MDFNSDMLGVTLLPDFRLSVWLTPEVTKNTKTVSGCMTACCCAMRCALLVTSQDMKASSNVTK